MMIFLLFKVAFYTLLSLLVPVVFVMLRHRLRQRHLRKITGPANPSFVAGHGRQMWNPFSFSFYESLFQKHGRVARVYGFFGDTQLVISDPKACSHMLVKDQAIFEEMVPLLLTVKSVFGPSLLGTVGEQHRKQRKMLNPVFSINHMRYMIPIFRRITNELAEILSSTVKGGPQEINIVDWLGRLAFELVGQAGLGYSFGSLEDRDDKFYRAIKEYMPTLSSLAYPRLLFPYVYNVFPAAFLKRVGRLLPWKRLHHLMDIADTMSASTKVLYEQRKKLLQDGDEATIKQVGEGRDVTSLLMRANVSASGADRLDEDEVLAQMSLFLLAGTDTTSSALSRILHLFALHPEVQEKLRSELKEACEDDDELAYDKLDTLPFLDAICRETLRLYPPSPQVVRTARADAVVPLSSPIRDTDGREIHDLFIPEDTTVLIQIRTLNRDPKIWGPDASEWKPERWLSPLPASVTEAKIQGVYSNTITFIGGSRSCIGVKFAQLEMKVVLSQLVPKFRFAPSKHEVIWRFGSVLSPAVKESVWGSDSELPIVVSLV
ncbi:cytochrome P450 [Gloeopeniophorella convolvens]|nr:cytochrome P450 [Gloeopeniophorella convolvens]